MTLSQHFNIPVIIAGCTPLSTLHFLEVKVYKKLTDAIPKQKPNPPGGFREFRDVVQEATYRWVRCWYYEINISLQVGLE